MPHCAETEQYIDIPNWPLIICVCIESLVFHLINTSTACDMLRTQYKMKRPNTCFTQWVFFSKIGNNYSLIGMTVKISLPLVYSDEGYFHWFTDSSLANQNTVLTDTWLLRWQLGLIDWNWQDVISVHNVHYCAHYPEHKRFSSDWVHVTFRPII